MRLILTDITKTSFILQNDDIVIENNGKIHHCIGCFDCWIKTPGECIIKDGYDNLGKLLGHCTELIIISKCTYGSVSPFIKNVLDRSLSYVLPYSIIIEGEMHNKKRYDNTYTITTYFYGENITDNEKETAHKFLKAFETALFGTINKTTFLSSSTELEGVL